MTHTDQVLNQPFTLPNGSVIKNRLVKSALSETLGTTDNHVTMGLARLYQRWAMGGMGILITGNVMIDQRALGEPNNVVVEDERDLELLTAKAGVTLRGKINQFGSFGIHLHHATFAIVNFI